MNTRKKESKRNGDGCEGGRAGFLRKKPLRLAIPVKLTEDRGLGLGFKGRTELPLKGSGKQGVPDWVFTVQYVQPQHSTAQHNKTSQKNGMIRGIKEGEGVVLKREEIKSMYLLTKPSAP